MLSINTNLSSLIAQTSLKNSTNILNQAVERMTTGYKINHAKDNAANYSISTNMTTKLNAYDVAADNVVNGMDLVTTAMDTISMMQDKAARLNALSTQARNGTYGAQSLSAINAEAGAIMSEIVRIYNTSQYNGVDLFNRTAYTIASHLPQAGKSGFIDETALISTAAAGEGAGIAEGEVVGTTTDAPKAKYNGFIEDPKTYTDAEVAAMTRVADVSTFTAGEKYSITSLEELQKLADYVNSGKDTTNVEFVLGADIDLSSISNWTPIGDYSTNTSYKFKGVFDGNGHVIKNLTIDNETKDYQGLFGRVESGEIKNVGIEGASVKGQKRVGGLVGYAYKSTITNSYATGSVTGQGYVGGLVGYSSSTITNSYATGDVTGQGNYVGGLTGAASSITNSYATGSVTGQGYVGGLAGTASSITNSYATGSVTGQELVGGLVGLANTNSTITNSYATGSVTGQDKVGGLAGTASSITNSYATGNVTGQGNSVGGLVGSTNSTITNSYATGDVTGQSNNVGGLVGSTNSTITNSYATGSVTGQNYVGGLVGYTDSTITNSYATGSVAGQGSVGGLAGTASSITNSYATGIVTGQGIVGGLVGSSYYSITNSYATGDVTGQGNYVGGLAGTASSITNSYATGNVSGTSSVGGLAGDASSITNSYASGNIEGVLSVGGLAGTMCSYNSILSNSFSTGNVTGDSQVGGLVGEVTLTLSISTSYSKGKVSGDEYVGGIIGIIDTELNNETNVSLDLSASYSQIMSDSDGAGNIIGGYVSYSDEDGLDHMLVITNTESISSVERNIGAVYDKEYVLSPDADPDASSYTEIDFDISYVENGYDTSVFEADINLVKLRNISTNLQVGINSDASSRLGFDMNFQFDLSGINNGIETDEAFYAINDFINQLSEKATMLGAVQNRLESALESIEVNINNLASSRSTIRDADIADESSRYIQQQILQQAAATLMSTANQSPAIALQLI